MVNCGGCGKFLSPTGGAACSAYPARFHKVCLGLQDKTPIGRDWVCPSCKGRARREDNTPVRSLGDGQGPPAGVASTVAPQGLPSSDGAGGQDELTAFMAEMRAFRTEMNSMWASLSVRMKSVEDRLDALEKDGGRGPDAGAERGTADLERNIAELKQELNDRDQEALLSDLEIGQLPEESGVSVAQSVTSLAARLGVSLEERDIVFAERVGPPPGEAGGRPRRVVVRLARRGLRDELLRVARVRRAPTAAAGARIYVNERLTRSNRQIFYRAREECRRLLWRYCWTKRGRVYVRRADGSPVFQLRSYADVDRVLAAPKS